MGTQQKFQNILHFGKRHILAHITSNGTPSTMLGMRQTEETRRDKILVFRELTF